jgi:hypothetical protein
MDDNYADVLYSTMLTEAKRFAKDPKMNVSEDYDGIYIHIGTAGGGEMFVRIPKRITEDVTPMVHGSGAARMYIEGDYLNIIRDTLDNAERVTKWFKDFRDNLIKTRNGA